MQKNVSSYAFDYVWSELGASWVYEHNLLRRVWHDDGTTEWGEIAFLLLLDHGWNTTAGCGAGSDDFRQVIEQGEAFLSRHPKSPHRRDVLFALAQAYETWWSLSLASAQDDYVTAARYTQGADSAREKAIAAYREILKLAPGSPEAGRARLVLPSLLLRLDTNQRRYFCVYD